MIPLWLIPLLAAGAGAGVQGARGKDPWKGAAIGAGLGSFGALLGPALAGGAGAAGAAGTGAGSAAAAGAGATGAQLLAAVPSSAVIGSSGAASAAAANPSLWSSIAGLAKGSAAKAAPTVLTQGAMTLAQPTYSSTTPGQWALQPLPPLEMPGMNSSFNRR